jgi:hypothetical protein
MRARLGQNGLLVLVPHLHQSVEATKNQGKYREKKREKWKQMHKMDESPNEIFVIC